MATNTRSVTGRMAAAVQAQKSTPEPVLGAHWLHLFCLQLLWAVLFFGEQLLPHYNGGNRSIS